MMGFPQSTVCEIHIPCSTGTSLFVFGPIVEIQAHGAGEIIVSVGWHDQAHFIVNKDDSQIPISNSIKSLVKLFLPKSFLSVFSIVAW